MRSISLHVAHAAVVAVNQIIDKIVKRKLGLKTGDYKL